MLIRCPRCSAGYEFPVEQLPPDGLRAKCARCAFVMLVKPGVGAVDPETGDTRVAFKPRTGGSEVTTVSRPREEKAVEEGPSIVVDIGQLGPESGEGAGEAERPAERPAERAAERAAAAFSPLSGHPRPTPASVPALSLAAIAALEAEPIDLTDMEVVIRPPGIWRLVVAVILLLVGLFFVFVWARNDWAPIWQDPLASISGAFEVKERPRVVKSDAPRPVIQVDEVRGELQLRALTARTIGQGRRRAAWVEGVVVNASNRAQKAIGIEVSVAQREGAPPVQSRVVVCCESLDEAAAEAILAVPDHPHLDERPVWDHAVRLAPGDERRFSVLVLDHGTALVPSARIKFSETEAAEAMAAPASAAAPPSAAPDVAAP